MKKRIVILTAFYPPFVSGAERFVVEIAQRLAAREEIIIITSRLRSDLLAEEIQDGVRIIRVGFGTSFDKYFYPILGALKALTLRPNVVHAVMESFAGLALCVFRLFDHNTSTILTLQSGSMDAPRLTKKIPRWLLKWIHTAPHKIHAISRALGNRARRLGALDVVVIPNGVHLAQCIAASHTTGKDTNFVLAIGRLHVDKGFDILIRAFARIAAESPSLRLQIGGEGEERENLARLIREYGLESRVTLLGAVPYEHVPTLMAQATLFVSPSRAEGMGNVFVEAQAAGTVVIGTRVGGISDVIEHGVTGLLVPPEDDEALAAAMRQLLDHSEERERMIQAARKRLDRYNWEAITEDIARLYDPTILLCTGIYPPEIGGPATAIADAARRLVSAGYRVRVVTYGNPEQIEDGVIHVSRRGSKLVRYARMCLTIRRVLDRNTLLVATDATSIGIPARLALIGRSNFFLLRLGGEWRWERAVEAGAFFGSLREYWKRAPSFLDRSDLAMYHWILYRARRIAVTSHLLKEIVIGQFPDVSAQIDVLPNVRTQQSPRHSRPSGPAHVPLRLVYVGRFVRVKNLSFLARVLIELDHIGFPVSCAWIGNGPLVEEIRRLVKDMPHMTFLGARSGEDVRLHLVESDALVLPSLSDLSPNVVVEALSCDVPVLCTSEHGLPAGFGGLLELSPIEVDAWKNAIQSLANPEAYEAFISTIRIPSLMSAELHEWVLRGSELFCHENTPRS